MKFYETRNNNKEENERDFEVDNCKQQKKHKGNYAMKVNKKPTKFSTLCTKPKRKEIDMDTPNFLHVMEEIIKPPYFSDMTRNNNLHA